MRGELPVCTRCCFCFPLRYGLITWGYLKLIAAVLVLVALILTLYNHIVMTLMYGYKTHFFIQIIIITVVSALLILDIVLNILFIVGGHTKNVKLLRIYYIYNIVLWALTIALVLLSVIIHLSYIHPNRFLTHRLYYVFLEFSSYLMNIVAQSYFLLLLRSEIIKLRNNCGFRFVNNAAEAECTMKYKEAIDVERDMEYLNGKETGDCRNSCEKGVLCEKK